MPDTPNSHLLRLNCLSSAETATAFVIRFPPCRFYTVSISYTKDFLLKNEKGSLRFSFDGATGSEDGAVLQESLLPLFVRKGRGKNVLWHLARGALRLLTGVPQLQRKGKTQKYYRPRRGIETAFRAYENRRGTRQAAMST